MADLMDELIDVANARSRKSGQNGAEELLQVLLQTGLAEELPAVGTPAGKEE
jgi:hypothetical protein